MKKHPQLAKKFRLLYSLRANATIKSNAGLARSLGTSRQAVSRWCRGNATRHGDCIPDAQLLPLSKAFNVNPHWFTLPLAEFETRLTEMLSAKTSGPFQSPLQISTSTMPITHAEIVGRENELEMLNDSWGRPEVNVVQVVAFGGVGKSALINRWLSDLSREYYREATRVYAWSFYWQGHSSDHKSSGDFFIEHALEWFGDENPSKGTPWAKAIRLAKLIRSYRTLLILDGLEPLQHSPGPKCGQIENPAVALLIKELAADNSGLCVITSRLTVTDLQSYDEERVISLNLDHLSRNASKAILKNMGIVGVEVDYEEAIEVYAGHPLSLSLLAGYLSVIHHGDVSKFRELKSLLDEQSLGSHAKDLMQVYINWFIDKTEIELLYMIGMFDRAVPLSQIETIANRTEIVGLTAKLAKLSAADWSYAVHLLKGANLISTDFREEDMILDCHPIVRDFVSDHLQTIEPDLWKKAHEIIFEHLQEVAVADPANMADLEPLFRAVIHGTQAEKFEEAFELYFDRIKKRYPMLSEGSHHADQACIRSFFDNSWSKPTATLPKNSQFYLMSSVAANLMSLGNLVEANEPALKSIEYFVQEGMWLEATNVAGPLVSMLIEAGDLLKAIDLMNMMQASVANTDNPVVTAMALNFQAYSKFLRGEDAIASELFEQVEEILTQFEPMVPVTFPTISSYYCKFLLDRCDVECALERSLKTFGWRRRSSWQVAIDTTSLLASDILVLGLTFLKLGDLVNAKIQLDKQVELFRSSNEWLYIPTGLNSRARYHIATENFRAALNDLQESLEISRRTGARFGEWEAYIDLAQLYFKQGELDASEAFLSKAKELPNMDAYRFRDDEIADLESSLAL